MHGQQNDKYTEMHGQQNIKTACLVTRKNARTSARQHRPTLQTVPHSCFLLSHKIGTQYDGWENSCKYKCRPSLRSFSCDVRHVVTGQRRKYLQDYKCMCCVTICGGPIYLRIKLDVMKVTQTQYNGNQTVYSSYRNAERKAYIPCVNILNIHFITQIQVKYQVHKI